MSKTIRRFIERYIVADDPAPEPLMPGILRRAAVRSSDSERELREVWSKAEHFPRLGRVSVQQAPDGSRLTAIARNAARMPFDGPIRSAKAGGEK